jgi:colicin import membrane protein
MTKAQLAAVRRISVASADRLIRRQSWRKHPGNDGRARVLVPRTWAEPSRNGATDAPPRDPTDKMPDHPTDAASDPTDISSAISALKRAIIASEKRADHAENRANLAGIRAEQAESRADGLRERVEGLLTQLATAEAGASASREQLAAAERRADTERERADRAEAAAAHERQDFLDVEVLTRRELDTLREQLAEAEKGRAAAESAVLQAAQTADEALQIAAARQRLGLMARLRAAWRGE